MCHWPSDARRNVEATSERRGRLENEPKSIGTKQGGVQLGRVRTASEAHPDQVGCSGLRHVRQGIAAYIS